MFHGAKYTVHVQLVDVNCNEGKKLKIVPQRLHAVKRVKYSGRDFRAGTRTYALLLGVAKLPITAISSDKNFNYET